MEFLLIDNYYNIISVFDNKCLIYKNNKLDIDDCNKKKINLKILLLLIILYVQKLIMLIVYMIINSYEYL